MKRNNVEDIIVKGEFWLRLCLLLENHARVALLNILHNVYNQNYQALSQDPTQLYIELKNCNILNTLKRQKIIKDHQWDLLFPANLQTDSSKFDITLIVILIRNCTNLSPPANGWKKKPSQSDKGIAACCLRVRDDLRNRIYHYGNIASMTKKEFLQIWNELEQILIGLGYNNNIQDLQMKSLDPRRVDYLKHFLNYLKARFDVLQNVVDENTTDIGNLKMLAGDVFELKEMLQHCQTSESVNDLLIKYQTVQKKHEKDIEEMNKKILENQNDIQSVRTDVENIKEDVKKNHESLVTQVNNLKLEPSTKLEGMYWNIHQNVDNFTGRLTVLEEIHQKFHIENDYNYSAVCLIGLGGIGKTEVAARYINLHQKETYDNIFWLNADSLNISLQRLASYLDLDCKSNTVEALTNIISTKIKRSKNMFILDNTVDLKSIKPFLTNLHFKVKPHVIITSQWSQWSGVGIQNIHMDVFTKEEAEAFFCNALPPTTDIKDVIGLAADLQYLPLAMQQARSYVLKHHLNIQSYLEYFREGHKQLLNINLEETGTAFYDKTLLTVWRLAYDKLVEHGNHVAIDVLNMMAYMDGSFINTKTFTFYNEIKNEIELNEMIDILCEYSLITRKKNAKFEPIVVMMHSLVQKIIIISKDFQKSGKNNDFYIGCVQNLLVAASSGMNSGETDDENLWYIHFKILLRCHNYMVSDLWAAAKHISLFRFDTEFLKHLNELEEFAFGDEFKPVPYLRMKCSRVNNLLNEGRRSECLKLLTNFHEEIKKFTKENDVLYVVFSLRYVFMNTILNNKSLNVKTVYNSVVNEIRKHSGNCVLYYEMLRLDASILFYDQDYIKSLRRIDEFVSLASPSTMSFNIINMLTMKASIFYRLNNSDKLSDTITDIEDKMKLFDLKLNQRSLISIQVLKSALLAMKRDYISSLNVLEECETICRSYKLTEDLASCHVNKAIVYYKLHDYEKASKMTLLIDHEEHLIKKGCLLMCLNKPKEAKVAFQIYLDKVNNENANVIHMMDKIYVLDLLKDEARRSKDLNPSKFSARIADCKKLKMEIKEDCETKLIFVVLYVFTLFHLKRSLHFYQHIHVR